MNKSLFRSTLSAHKLAFFLVAAAVTTATGAVLLTPGTGVSATSPTRASFVNPTDIKFKIQDGSKQIIHVPDAAETVMHKITIKPAVTNNGIVGSTGWHSHPGPVVVLIESGTMSFYDADDPTCTVRTYTAGQAFIDSGQGHAHIARNEGSVDLVLAATYFDVPPGGLFRLDAVNPETCSF
ncbi:MAG: hypothetical protein H0V90_13065 [Blastocatellia bacterium]|nr:hypothetical protein [Blastocatellia bacterium]